MARAAITTRYGNAMSSSFGTARNRGTMASCSCSASATAKSSAPATVGQTRHRPKITRAMQMVASAKMRRAQDQAVKGRPYIRALAEVLYHLQDEIDTSNSPLMQTHGGADLVLLVNTDRGLCGGLNANLIKMVREQAPENAHYITIGRKLNAALAKLNERLEATWSLTDPLSLLELKPVFDFIVQKFKAEEYGRVFVAFSGFVNTMVQKPVFRQLLPIEPEPLMNMAKAGGSSLDGAEAHKQFLLEPSPAALLDTILPLYVFHGLVQIVLEARASEHSARMVAMKGATENAKNIIGGLTLDYNKARQTQITNELLEITTAMRAME